MNLRNRSNPSDLASQTEKALLSQCAVGPPQTCCHFYKATLRGKVTTIMNCSTEIFKPSHIGRVRQTANVLYFIILYVVECFWISNCFVPCFICSDFKTSSLGKQGRNLNSLEDKPKFSIRLISYCLFATAINIGYIMANLQKVLTFKKLTCQGYLSGSVS